MEEHFKRILQLESERDALLDRETKHLENIRDLESDLRRVRQLVYFAGMQNKLWEEAQVREPGITPEEFQYLIQP